MNPLLVAPLLLTLVGLAAGWFLPRLASPAATVRALAAISAAAAAAVTAALVLVVLAGASELRAVSDLIGWCEALYPGDHGAAPWAGALAGLALAAASWRAVRHHRRIRAERHHFGHVRGVEVVPAAGPVAFAVPGDPGGVVLGDELVRSLAPDERDAVVAHEAAHLDLHHHRYVRVAETCAAAFPVLLPIARQVRFNTERWADEAAASRVGSRRVVARAIARVALLGEPSTPAVGLALGGLGPGARVEALLHPRRHAPYRLPAVAIAVTMLVTAIGASVQVHHLATFLVHACR